MIARRSQSYVAMTAMVASLFATFEPVSSALASPMSMARSAIQTDDGFVAQVAGRGGRGGGGGFRGGGGGFRGGGGGFQGANVNRNLSGNFNRNANININRNVNVNRKVVRTGAWVRPGRYWWPRGGAIAAGAAIGFVAAATAVAWAGAAPAPGMCWYYTDPSMRQGFWDYCQ